MNKPSWIKNIVFSEEFKTVIASPYHEIKDFKQDPAGFVIIKVLGKKIHLGWVEYQNKEYVCVTEIIGEKAQDIYHELFNKQKIVLFLDHAAYIGKELKKAEIAIKTGELYEQEQKITKK